MMRERLTDPEPHSWFSTSPLDAAQDRATAGVFRARSTPLSVISAVTPRGIVRAICHFGHPGEMIEELTKAIGVLNGTDVEWTGFVYTGLPYYVDQHASAYDVPGGIYLFPWVLQPMAWNTPAELGTRWREPEHRISERVGQLLWRPPGWAG